MGHGLLETDTMVSGEMLTPWHGLGTVVPGLLSSAEALKLGGLDWTVRKEPIFFGDSVPVPDRFAVVRNTDDRPLGVVGSDYKIIDNVDAFQFLDTIMDSGENKYTTAGSLFNGSKVFLTAKIGDTFTVNGDDAMESYLLITTSHDSSQAFTAAVTTIRVVCNNTLTWALNAAKSKWTLTHRQTLEGKTHEAKETLGLVHAYEAAFQAEVDQLVQAEVTKDKFLKIMEDVLPDQKRQLPKNLEELEAVWTHEPTNPEGENGWRAVNTATFWADHARGFRDEDARFKALTTGWVATMRGKVKDRVLASA